MTEIRTMRFDHGGVHLPVKNLKETMNYYKTVLGFYDEWTEGERDGGLRRDNLRVLFGEDPEHLKKINDATHALNLMWFVENIKEIYQEFQNKKIQIESPLQSYTYGLMEFAFKDINGYLIRIAEREI
ncbi:VOC family protein [Flavitalea sp.]|nr:VOC family protein [Flavitalea sp.]